MFWTANPPSRCNFEDYAVLFEGIGVKVTSETSPTIYFGNSTDGVQFGLAVEGEDSLCGYRLVQNILSTAYFNTKISYLSRHSTQFGKLYQDILFYRCNLERQSLMNALSQVKTDPKAFTILLMKNRGYTAYAAGEAVHIIQCQPVQCTINHLEDCYHELPVNCEGKAMFLKPNSRIITSVATPVDCNRFLPIYFELQGIWHQLVPQAMRVDSPQLLAPQRKPV